MDEIKLVSEETALKHFGVRGMRWGVRRDKDLTNRQRGARKAAKTRARRAKIEKIETRIAKNWSLKKRGGKYVPTGNTYLKAAAASWLAPLMVSYIKSTAVEMGRNSKVVRTIAWNLGKVAANYPG